MSLCPLVYLRILHGTIEIIADGMGLHLYIVGN